MTDHFPDAGKMVPKALRLADYWENSAQNLQRCIDENLCVVQGYYNLEGMKREQSRQMEAVAELRRLHAEVEATAEHYRMDLERDTALLRQALEVLELVVADVKTTPNAYEALRQAIAALKERLGEKT